MIPLYRLRLKDIDYLALGDNSMAAHPFNIYRLRLRDGKSVRIGQFISCMSYTLRLLSFSTSEWQLIPKYVLDFWYKEKHNYKSQVDAITSGSGVHNIYKYTVVMTVKNAHT